MDTEEKDGVVDTSFVRKEFYVEPPVKGAPVEEWNAWLKADASKAKAAKAAYTKSFDHAEVPEFLQPKVLSKVGGVYRQSAMVGFVTDGDTARVEAAVDADQTKTIATAGFTHGGRGSAGSQRLSGAQRRKAKKASRKARLRIVKH